AYSLPVVHNFSVHPEEMDKLIEHLFPPAAEGKNVRPKNKTRRERTDIVAAGAVILQTVFREIGASHYRCCAAGLRDGLYFAAAYPGRLSDRPILDRSIDGLLAQYPVVPLRHVR